MLEILPSILQTIIGAGLLNVWLLRAGRGTAYRGGSAENLREEFRAYGLPVAVFYAVGCLKVVGGGALIAGIWLPQLVLPAAATIAVLMVGALAMHAKVGDAPVKSLPAALMLAMCLGLLALQL